MLLIQADTRQIVELVTRKRGEYILGKTVLKEPMSRIELRLASFLDRIELSATIEGSAPKLKENKENVASSDLIVSTIENVLNAKKYRAYTAQHITIGSDKKTNQPRISVHGREKVDNPYASLGSILLFDPIGFPKSMRKESLASLN